MQQMSANHSALKMDLQLFSEFEDAILPDDYQESPPQDEGIQADPDPIDPNIDAEDTKPAEIEDAKPEENPTAPQTLKLKYNSEEREIPLEEAVALAQKGMNYDKAVERARQEARDAFIASQGYTWNGKPITTESDYLKAKDEERIYQEVMKLAEKEGIPEEFAERMIKLEQKEAEREKETQRLRQEQEEKARHETNMSEFLAYFREENGRGFDTSKDTIPQEVKEMYDQGTPLKFAFMQYQNKQLRTQLKVAKKNEENIKRAPLGSVSAHGSTEVAAEDDFMMGFNSV